MRILPVIDLMGGHVVRGVAGRRSEYRLIQSQLAGDAWPVTTARVLTGKFGFREAYVADLDAIMHGQRNKVAWEWISEAGLKLWLDAGVGSVSEAKVVLQILSHFANDPTIVLGLETFGGLDFEDLIRILGPERMAFSLDMKSGKPLTTIPQWQDRPPIDIARAAINAGVQKLIILDLADVGVGEGPQTLPLCREIRHEFPAIEIIAGGGVRGIDDLRALADSGCDAALVASALHDCRLSVEDVHAIEHYAVSR